MERSTGITYLVITTFRIDKDKHRKTSRRFNRLRIKNILTVKITITKMITITIKIIMINDNNNDNDKNYM